MHVMTPTRCEDFEWFRTCDLLVVESDGSCLYHAIKAAQTLGENRNGHDLRASLANYVLALTDEDWRTIMSQIPMDIAEHRQAVLSRIQTNEWAEIEELLLLSNYLQRKIVVVDLRSETYMGIKPVVDHAYVTHLDHEGSSYEPTALILSYTGSHYNALVPPATWPP
jgi:hypothetical protein